MKKQNKNIYLRKIIFFTIFVLLLFSGIFFINKKNNFFSKNIKNLFTIVLEKDIFTKRLYIMDAEYDSFKKQVVIQTKGKITFCDKFPKIKEFYQNQVSIKDIPSFDLGIRFDGITNLSSLGPNSAIVKFSYCKDENDMIKFGHAIVKFDSFNRFKIIKIDNDQSFIFSSSWDYGEWIKLEKEYGVKNYPSRNFVSSSALVGFMKFQEVKKLNNGWSEIYFNPFLLGLNEEKPYKNNDIYFGLYKSKPVLFFTNEYLRYRLKLKENQGMATDFEGQEHFVNFKDVTNQIYMNGIDEPNMYVDTKIRSVSDTEYHFSAPLIQVDNGNYFIISEEVTVSFSDQRETDFKAIWMNSQPEITNKIINDYKQYLIDKNKAIGFTASVWKWLGVHTKFGILNIC